MKRPTLRKQRDDRAEQVSIPTAATGQLPPEEDNIYVLNDNDAEAKAFDAFYGAYDEVHDKTRKFLLD